MIARRPVPATRPPVVLVFGESINDSASIAELIVAANPALSGLVRALPRPVSLTRQAKDAPVKRWTEDVGRIVRGTEAAGTSVRAVVVHRDGDGPDPAGTVEKTLASQLAHLSGQPAVPVQAMEAWWFLFPDAVEAVRPRAWQGRLPRRPRDVETIHQPKVELQRLTRWGKAAEYAEADSRVIAKYIRLHSPPQYGSSASFQRFSTMARTL
jgi:hypothetical protein